MAPAGLGQCAYLALDLAYFTAGSEIRALAVVTTRALVYVRTSRLKLSPALGTTAPTF